MFVYFSDHGAPGLIAFPSDYLYADQLIKTLGYMHEYGITMLWHCSHTLSVTVCCEQQQDVPPADHLYRGV